MSKFQKRVESKKRITKLGNVFIDVIEEFNSNNPDLTWEEVTAVMLKMMSDANDKAIREAQ